MTQNIQNYIDEIEDYVGGNIEGNQIGIDRMGFTVFLRATLTKVTEEARREERNRVTLWAMEVLPFYPEAQKALIEFLADNK